MSALTLRHMIGVSLLFTAVRVHDVASQSAPPPDSSIEAMLAKVEAAQVSLVRGNAEPFKALWSRADDVTLIGGLGGAIEKGWSRVSQRLDWVSTQYADGTRKHEEISRIVSPQLVVIVQRESIAFRSPGTQRQVTQELRATMVFRREASTWRLLHRHADSQVAREATR